MAASCVYVLAGAQTENRALCGARSPECMHTALPARDSEFVVRRLRTDSARVSPSTSERQGDLTGSDTIPLYDAPEVVLGSCVECPAIIRRDLHRIGQSGQCLAFASRHVLR